MYEVALYFSSKSIESPYDKLKRIILNDCANRYYSRLEAV